LLEPVQVIRFEALRAEKANIPIARERAVIPVERERAVTAKGKGKGDRASFAICGVSCKML